MSSWLSEREPGTNTFDALRAGIANSLSELGNAGPDLEWKALRHRLVRENESLAAHSDHLHGKFAELVSNSVAEDLGDAPSDLRPRLVAAAMMAAMDVVDELSEENAAEHSRATFESLLAFLQGVSPRSRSRARQAARPPALDDERICLSLGGGARQPEGSVPRRRALPRSYRPRPFRRRS